MSFENLVKIMESLRDDGGCPWDREQTRQSLKPYLVEEAYELYEAIEEESPEMIKEELGDLLFQILFHAQIAKERGEFDIDDVIERISEKMVSRHPHVFGDLNLETPDEVLKKWDEHKRREGKLKDSLLEGIPKSLPSILKAHRVQERASTAGFDWPRTDDVFLKLEEEVAEFEEALKDGKREAIEEELGDIFFTLVNISRFVGVNPDDALRKTISKFIHRFRYIEKKAREKGQDTAEYSLEKMEELWAEAKEQ